MMRSIALVCGGGPAPGINSVIAAATIRADLDNVRVLGIHHGFSRLMQGDASCAQPLHIRNEGNIIHRLKLDENGVPSFAHSRHLAQAGFYFRSARRV